MEQFSNLSIGFLNGAVSSTSSTSITLHNSTSFPSTGNFTVKCDNEIMLVSANASNVLTVARGQEGTTAATHADGAPVYAVVTSGSIQRLAVQSHGGTVIGARRQINFIDANGVTWTLTDDATNNKMDIQAAVTPSPTFQDALVAPPSAGTFTWANQDLATVVTPSYGNCLLMRNTNNANSANLNVLYIAAPTPPYTLIGKIRATMIPTAAYGAGLFWYDGTKYIMVGLLNNQIVFYEYTNNTTLSSGVLGVGMNGSSHFPACWIKLKDDNTNRIAYISDDGETWTQMISHARTTFLTPTSIGWGINCGFNASAWPVACTLESWNVTTP